MQANSEKAYARGFGRLPLIAAARVVPANGADPTVTHLAGIETFARTGEGAWSATLSNNVLDVLPSGFPFAQLVAVAVGVYSDDTFHELEVRSLTEATGVITIRHRFCTYATIVSAGPVVDDVAGLAEIHLFVYALES